MHWNLFGSEADCFSLTAHSTWNWFRLCKDIWLVYFSSIIYIWCLDNLYFHWTDVSFFCATRTNDPHEAIDRIVRGSFFDSSFIVCAVSPYSWSHSGHSSPGICI
jgi:hypothetical protein